jgi:hypothetical protein
MKKKLTFAMLMITAACKPGNSGDPMKTAAIRFAGAFITDSVPSSLSLRITGQPEVITDGDNFFRINGQVEGYSSYNVPFEIDHFSEVIHFSGSDPNARKNWTCSEIYLGRKKLK